MLLTMLLGRPSENPQITQTRCTNKQKGLDETDVFKELSSEVVMSVSVLTEFQQKCKIMEDL